MAFCDAQDFIDRFDPITEESFFAEQCSKDLTESSVKPLSLGEEGPGALRVTLGKSEQLGAALRRDDFGKEKKMEELFPGEIGGR